MHGNIRKRKAGRPFLSALEAENIDIITKADATSSFGWQPGKRFIPGHDKDIVLDIDPSQKGMAAAYRQTGSFDKWKDTMQPHRERDKFRFILAAAFAAPAANHQAKNLLCIQLGIQ